MVLQQGTPDEEPGGASDVSYRIVQTRTEQCRQLHMFRGPRQDKVCTRIQFVPNAGKNTTPSNNGIPLTIPPKEKWWASWSNSS